MAIVSIGLCGQLTTWGRVCEFVVGNQTIKRGCCSQEEGAVQASEDCCFLRLSWNSLSLGLDAR